MKAYGGGGIASHIHNQHGCKESDASAVLILGNASRVHIECKDGWVPEGVWTFRNRKGTFTADGIRTTSPKFSNPARSVITIYIYIYIYEYKMSVKTQQCII